jgi:hypothetical protein
VRRYAQRTEVSVIRSRMEVEEMLHKHRADRVVVAQDRAKGLALVAFVLDGRAIRFKMALPPEDPEVTKRQQDAWDQLCRQRWRALVLALKSKFVSIDEGIETTEQAFLAHIWDPDSKQTIHELMEAKLADAYRKGLPALPSGMEGSP